MCKEYFCPPTLAAYMKATGCCEKCADFRRLPMEKLEQVGWAGLSTAESGRIGGMVGAKKRKMRKE